MEQKDIVATLETVKKCDQKIFDLSHVTQFKGYRTMRDDSVHPITVEVLDTVLGPVRYHVTATDDKTGAVASGNGGDKLETALLVLHWWDLEPKTS